MKIGYIGLGLMGKPCVLNLLGAGFDVSVWARREASVKPLVDKGAKACPSPKELALCTDVVILNVTNAADVQNIVLGESGLASSNKKGLIIVDMSTISACATKEIADKLAKIGMEFIDAPVSGGTAGAEKGTLSFMLGGKAETIEKIRPILQSMGTTITRIGDSGAGQVAKSCNQIALTAALIGVAEAIKFAKQNGVDPLPVREALLGGLAASKALDIHGMRIIKDVFTPGFKAVLHLKDMKIVAEICKELSLDLPVTDLGLEYLERAVDSGFGEEDSAVIARVLR